MARVRAPAASFTYASLGETGSGIKRRAPAGGVRLGTARTKRQRRNVAGRLVPDQLSDEMFPSLQARAVAMTTHPVVVEDFDSSAFWRERRGPIYDEAQAADAALRANGVQSSDGARQGKAIAMNHVVLNTISELGHSLQSALPLKKLTRKSKGAQGWGGARALANNNS